jgi:hypothetical protein
MNDIEQQHSSNSNLFQPSDNEWRSEATIDELQRNLAAVKQMVTNDSGQKLVIRKYQSQCIRLAPLIPIAEPVPEYLIQASDLKSEVRQALRKIHHPELKRLVLHQAVLRLFEAIGIEPYISIGRRLIVKLVGD